MTKAHAWVAASAITVLCLLGGLPGCYLTHGLHGFADSDDGRSNAPLDRFTDLAPLEGPLGCEPTTPPEIKSADLLFVVDNSGSMIEEQAALGREFPKIVRVLTTGDTDGDGATDFPPARDLHLGVVSTDMGLSGITDVQNCAGLGDDGVLQHAPAAGAGRGCRSSYPAFLSYQGDVDDASAVARDFACIASLGTGGCGFEQQLESGLKALWPSVDRDPRTGQTFTPNRVRFLNQTGHGDLENSGFLRNDPSQGLSLVAVVVVSDEEDCSAQDTGLFTPMHLLQPQDPLARQDLNLRCFYNKKALFPVQRYVNGLRALRPGNEALVMFAAIVGVPEDLVERSGAVFADATERDRYYDRILGDKRMVEVVDMTEGGLAGVNLKPSCTSDNGRAYPPRRIVEVARGFGENGIVQSICSGNFGTATDAILKRIGTRLADPCLLGDEL